MQNQFKRRDNFKISYEQKTKMNYATLKILFTYFNSGN